MRTAWFDGLGAKSASRNGYGPWVSCKVQCNQTWGKKWPQPFDVAGFPNLGFPCLLGVLKFTHGLDGKGGQKGNHGQF